MDEHSLIKAGILDIFRDNGFANHSSMTQRDFDHISEQLRQKSGTLISGTTIKRLAHGEFSRQPQIATLNAIANYFDYKTWQDYKADKLRSVQLGTPPTDPVEERQREPVKAIATELISEPAESIKNPVRSVAVKSSVTILKYLSVPLALVIIASLYFFGTSKAPIAHADKATFSFKKNTSNDIPNSVVFSYNVDSVQADSFFIQQSWDANRRVRIYKNKYTLTDIYYEPGYHIAKLIANDSVIHESTSAYQRTAGSFMPSIMLPGIHPSISSLTVS
jgi:hypothetical protein